MQNTIMTTLDKANKRDSVAEKVRSTSTYYDIDWDKSRAVYLAGGIRFRPETDKETLIEELTERFDARFSEYIPDEVRGLLSGSEVWQGKHLNSAPDLAWNPFLSRYYHIRDGNNKSQPVVSWNLHEERWNHEHDPIRIFISDGPRFASNEVRASVDISDVFMMILGAYGLSSKGSFDGQCRTAAFSMTPKETVAELPPPQKETKTVEEEYTEKIEQQLKDMGYIQ